MAADIVTCIAAAVLYITAVSRSAGSRSRSGVATLLDLFVVYFFKRPTVFLIARKRRLVGTCMASASKRVAGEAEARDALPAPEVRHERASRARRIAATTIPHFQ